MELSVRHKTGPPSSQGIQTMGTGPPGWKGFKSETVKYVKSQKTDWAGEAQQQL
jgi:hypothetical protein